MRQARISVPQSSRPFTQSSIRHDEAETTTKTAPQAPPSTSAAVTIDTASTGSTQASTGAKSQSATKALLDRNTTTAGWAEKALYKRGQHPIGSRRRRAAIRTSDDVPFEQLPYQCFQEARKILQADRAEKIKAIAAELDKIKRLEEVPAEKYNGGQAKKSLRLASLRKHVEELKILADINDPMVKRKFEDGLGRMPFLLSALC